MHRVKNSLPLIIFTMLLTNTTLAQAGKAENNKIISEATNGKYSALEGSISECDEQQDYTAEITDLNKDGQPEVLVNISGSCLGGMAGSFTDLYIKNKTGKWVSQFGFPGMPEILKTKNKGYPDIEIGGPGFCFPVWRWDGQKYKVLKKCKE